MSADGADLVSLVVDEPAIHTSAARDREDAPSWAPDGRSIAFASRGDSGAWAIWVISASGGAPRRLMPELDRSHQDVSWSPRVMNDVVYVAENDVWRVDLPRGVHENLTKGRVTDPHSPRFSADGARLALSVAGSAAIPDRDLYVLDLATLELTAITHDEFDDFGAVWSPDGRSLLFARVSLPVGGREPAVLELWRVLLNSSDPPVQVTDDVTANFAPDWYPRSSCDGVSDEERGRSP
jgi:Tol biopolymer transport system component